MCICIYKKPSRDKWLGTDFQIKIVEIRCQYAVFMSPTLEIYRCFGLQ